MEPILEEHEAFSDDELLAQLDEHYKWELRTDDAQFDTHYHTLREALTFVRQMNSQASPINAIARLDGTILIEGPQVVRIMNHIGLQATAN